jgi:hypothetical protein
MDGGIMSIKVICVNRGCNWRGMETELLTAQDPFDVEEILTACPRCKGIFELRIACDEPGCWYEVTCGTPTPNGYRQTCGKHAPKGDSK